MQTGITHADDEIFIVFPIYSTNYASNKLQALNYIICDQNHRIQYENIISSN